MILKLPFVYILLVKKWEKKWKKGRERGERQVGREEGRKEKERKGEVIEFYQNTENSQKKKISY